MHRDRSELRHHLDITQQVEMLNFGLALDTVLGAMEIAVPREG
jgi:hypothetical protein